MIISTESRRRVRSAPRASAPIRASGTLWTLLALAACGGGGDGSGGGVPPPATDTTAPSVPQNVAAQAESSSQVRVNWQASTDAGSGVAGYRVYRDGAATPVANVTAGTTSFTDTGLTPATQYVYVVRAFDAATPSNESDASASASVTTPAAPAVALTTEPAFPSLPAFTAPVLALQAPGDGSQWFVVEQAGRVLAFDDRPEVAATRVFVDLRARVSSGNEKGLLGMAFHPGFPADPRVFLSYTADVGGELVSRVSSFRTNDAGATLDPSSEVVLFTITQPAANHNGGNLAFGGDDLLYAGFGDGGSADDPWGDIGNGQDLHTLLGKMVRIDVDGSAGALPYGIPAGNPYAGNAPCDTGRGAADCPEIYAYGFRNPWRWSFDRATGELWVADVGQSAREEVDRVVADGNYGWRCFEGTQRHSTVCGPNEGSSLPPVVEYDHSAGNAITGGYRYRGSAIPSLQGEYVFGDFGSGRLWHVPGTVAPTRVVTVADATDTSVAISSFAEDVEGELYVVDYGGALYRLRAAE